MNRNCRIWIMLLSSSIALNFSAHADVVGVGLSAFPGSATVLDFNGLPTGLEVNGLSLSGVHFDYTVAGTSSNGVVQIDGGPGVTNNIAPPNIVSIGNNRGALIITLPSAVNLFGYGYAVSTVTNAQLANATSASAFDGGHAFGFSLVFRNSRPYFLGRLCRNTIDNFIQSCGINL